MERRLLRTAGHDFIRSQAPPLGGGSKRNVFQASDHVDLPFHFASGVHPLQSARLCAVNLVMKKIHHFPKLGLEDKALNG